MSNPFFEKPILNSPYAYPKRHWELDEEGQPTQHILEARRKAACITPIPKSRKRKGEGKQQDIVFDEGKGLSSGSQQCDPSPELLCGLLRDLPVAGIGKGTPDNLANANNDARGAA